MSIKVSFIYFDLNIGRFFAGFSHGLAYIIGALRQDGNKVSLHHLLDKKDFKIAIDFLLHEKPDVIGLSFCTHQKGYVRQFLKMLDSEKTLKQKLIIAGGPHVSSAKELVFENFPEIRAICIGEGEIPLRDLCRRLDNNIDILSTPSFYFNIKREVIKNHIAPLQDIETLTFPDYSLL